ncbi:SWR1-complex protein 3 [Hanseniaspora uvarum DSM 2768]|nr:SWR1-complex protein 3 [Hanseniaspora uvarum DSM 2768]
MAVKRAASNNSTLNSKKQKTDESNILVNNLPTLTNDQKTTSDQNYNIPQSGVFEASLIKSIKTMLYNPIIFKKYFHKVKDNSNRNVSIRIFFLKISHLKNTKDQVYHYFQPFLNYYHLTLEYPDDDIIIDNLPKETLQQSMNGSMHRLVDSVMKINNFHQFKVRLYIIKNQQIELDFVEEQQRNKQMIQELKEKEKEMKQRIMTEKHEKMQQIKEQKEQERLMEKKEKEKLQKDKLLEKEKEKLNKQELMNEKIKIKEQLQFVNNQKTVIKSEKQIRLDEFKERINEIDLKKSELRKQEHTLRREYEKLFVTYSKKISEYIALRKEHNEKVTKEDKEMKNKAETWDKLYQNKKMVYHLDKMAKNNADLNLLMTTLAAGKGSHDQVLKFREYMNKAKALDAVEEWQPANNYLQVLKFKELVFNMKELKKRKNDEFIDLINKNKEARKVATDERVVVQKQREDYLKEYYEIQKQKNDEKKATLQKQAEVKNSDIQPQEKIVKTENVEKLKEVKKEEDPKEKVVTSEKPKAKVVKKKIPKSDVALTSFQNKYTKKSDIVFEFSDNLNDRYLLPKDSILEYDDSTQLLKISWISILNTGEIEGSLGRAKKLATEFDYETNMSQLYTLEILEASSVKPIYCSNTIELSEIPLKYLSIIKANLNDYNKVYEIMTWIINNGTTVDMHDIKYTLSKEDETEQEMAENFREEVYKFELSKSKIKK